MNTKVTTLVTASLLVALTVSGCSSEPATVDTPTPPASTQPSTTESASETPVEVVEELAASELTHGEVIPADKVDEYTEVAKDKKGVAIVTGVDGDAMVIVKGKKPSEKVVKFLNDTIEATGARESAKFGTSTQWGARDAAAITSLMPLHNQGIEFVTVLTAADIDGNEVLRSYFYVAGSGPVAAELKDSAHLSDTYAGALAHAEKLAAKYPGTIVIK